jgi:hypothetical protein
MIAAKHGNGAYLRIGRFDAPDLPPRFAAPMVGKIISGYRWYGLAGPD